MNSYACSILGKVKPSCHEETALMAMKHFSPYYDIKNIINSYWKMREIKISLKEYD